MFGSKKRPIGRGGARIPFGGTGYQLGGGSVGTPRGGFGVGSSGRYLGRKEGTGGSGIGGGEQQSEEESIQWRKARVSAYFKETGCNLWTTNLLSALCDEEFDEAMKYGPPDMYIWDPEWPGNTNAPPFNGISMMAIYNMRAASANGQEQQNDGPSTSAEIYKKQEEQPMMEKKKDDDDIQQAMEAPFYDEGSDDEF